MPEAMHKGTKAHRSLFKLLFVAGSVPLRLIDIFLQTQRMLHQQSGAWGPDCKACIFGSEGVIEGHAEALSAKVMLRRWTPPSGHSRSAAPQLA